MQLFLSRVYVEFVGLILILNIYFFVTYFRNIQQIRLKHINKKTFENNNYQSVFKKLSR